MGKNTQKKVSVKKPEHIKPNDEEIEEVQEEKEVEEEVEDNSKKKKRIAEIVLTIIIIIIILLLLHRCGRGEGDPKKPADGPSTTSSQTTTMPADEIKPNSDATPDKKPGQNGTQYVTFPGYLGQKREFKTGESWNFGNPEENALPMIFEVKYNGKTIWTSEKVAPGATTPWVVSNTLSNKGAYDLSLMMYPVFDDGSAGNGAEGKITVIVS